VSLAQWSITVLWIGLTLYVLLAGVDFGAGFWDLFAGTSRSGRPQRDLIEHSIGPVWEANHVWLIFVIVLLWTAFPSAKRGVRAVLGAHPVLLRHCGRRHRLRPCSHRAGRR
jgi:cytochrome d ubiquinol oxidase subunit II